MHYLYLVADSSIAIADMLIKFKNLPQSESYGKSIDVLGDHNILPPDFAYEFAKIASFRNFLAHDYEKIDYALICKVILAKMKDVHLYLKHVDKALKP